MITESDKWKIREFVEGTSWSNLDWEDQASINDILEILKAFNDDPQLAIQYWKQADQKSDKAIRQYYLDTIKQMNITAELPIPKQAILDYFQGNQEDVNSFFERLQIHAQAISKEVFKTHFTDVVMEILGKQNAIH
ncbi:MAG: hypothetical protein AAF806_28055 [Bacteroidota bacterium]